MQEVVCWCCDYFIPSKVFNGKIVIGMCEYNGLTCFSESKVCKDFILRTGLHTTRAIPDICENYKNIIPAEDNK